MPNEWASALRGWWKRREPVIMPMAMVAMGILAILKIGSELHRLTLRVADPGAVDLKLRLEEVHRWFGDLPVYTELSRAVYPPQAYVLMWPLIGWPTLNGARWIWAITSLAALAWLAVLVMRESGAQSTRERLFIVLMACSMNAVGVTIGNGQLILHLLPALVAALLLLRRSSASLRDDALITLLLLVAAIKPTLAVPFVWVLLIATRRARPLVIAVVAYLLLTLLALGFQSAPFDTLVRQYREQLGLEMGKGYGDVGTTMFALGYGQWALAVGFLIVIVLGVWTIRRRRADFWILIAVASLVARFWTYHRVYDDVLLLIPMVALFRIAKLGDRDRGSDVVAALLLAVSVVAMLAPARMETSGPPLSWFFVYGHVLVWLAMLLFLLRVAKHDSRLGASPAAAH